MSVTREEAVNASTQTFVSALVLNAAIAGAQLAAFTLIRRHFRPVYEPRTFVPTDESKRAPPLSPSLLGWPLAVWRADPAVVLDKYGAVDAYCYLRFLRMVVRTLLPIWLVSWAVLMPADAAGTSNAGNTGLDRFTFGNVAPADQARYAAHLICVYLFTFWILWNLRSEMKAWLGIRQRWMVSDAHSRLPQARTVLFTGVPEQYLDEVRLAQLFSHIPGGTKHVWLNRNLKDMPDDYNARLRASRWLESATVKLVKTADKLRRKAERAAGKKGAAPLDEKWTATPSQLESEATVAERLVPASRRPHHRLPSPAWLPVALPFVGKKVDSISHYRDEVAARDESLRAKRDLLAVDVGMRGTGEGETYPPINSAFVLFDQQIGAHLACQHPPHHVPYTMNARYIETAPEDVIWSNLNMNPYDRAVRRFISFALTAAIIIFWAIPTAFVGAVSNVPNLCRTYSWLAWLCDLPTPVPGIISGILPPALLAVLFMLLPVIFRLLAKFEGVPKKTSVELSLMTRYFIFLVINGFIIVTLSSGIINALPELADNTSSFATALAANLPGASTFFLTYLALQGLAGSAALFLQYTDLVVYYAKLFLLAGTPRAVHRVTSTMCQVNWGTVFPDTSLLVVITIAYSVISPIINGLACFSFFLLYHAHKYYFIWCCDQQPWSETGGLFLPKAINHVFVGLYLEHICLATLFFLARDEEGKVSSIPQGVLTVVLMVITAGFQIILRDSYGPLRHTLPLTLAHRSFGMPPEAPSPSSSSSFEMVEHPSRLDRLRVKMVEGGHGKAARILGMASSEVDDGAPKTDLRRRSSHAVAGQTELAPDLGGDGGDVGTMARKPAPSQSGPSSSSVGDIEIEQERTRIEQETTAVFTHPAARFEQQTVWLPSDRLGVGDAAARDFEAHGVRATTRGATLTAKGKVEIHAGPPDDDLEEV